MMKLKAALALCFVIFQLEETQCYRNIRLGVLIATSPTKNQTELFCIGYYPNVYNFTKEREQVTYYPLSEIEYVSSEFDSCEEDISGKSVDGKFAFVDGKSNNSSRNCSIQERTRNVQDNHGIGVLLNSSLTLSNFNSSLGITVQIPLAALIDTFSMEKLLQIKKDHPDWSIGIYTPDDFPFDFSPLITMFLAISTVALGSLWSGYVKHHLRLRFKEETRKRRTSDPAIQDENGQENQAETGSRRGSAYDDRRDDEEQICEQSVSHPTEDISLRVSPGYVLFYVVLMCTMLVLLYNFIDYLVYFIIGMFCLTSIIAMYSCFEPFVMWTYECLPSLPTCRLPRCNLYLCIINMELRQFFLLVISTAVSIVWLVFRNEHWAWILQDFLGVLFSINMLKVIRLPSLKICTLLLAALFIYDIFFVFITRYITTNGKSIMVEVATGGESGEQVPMVLKVPHFNCDSAMNVCPISYSMLGFGDMLVPGLLLSYCHSFDLFVGTPCKLYWLITNIAYALGLGTTFVSLYLMESAQPALMFLVPFTLIPIFITAFARGELSAMWKGDVEVRSSGITNEDIDEEHRQD